jgi:hypothetical protein
LSKIVSLFVACLYVFILIQRGFEGNGSRQEKNQMAGSLVLDPLSSSFSVLVKYQCCSQPPFLLGHRSASGAAIQIMLKKTRGNAFCARGGGMGLLH